MKLKFIPKTKAEIFRLILNTLLVVLGTFVLAFGVSLFIIPFDLVTGGVTGIGILLKNIMQELPFFGELSTEVYVSAVNWILFFLGLVFLGRAFAMKTLVSAIVYPLALSLASFLIHETGYGKFFDLASDAYVGSYSQLIILLAAVFGGAFIGAGVALTFHGGGSTGGVDIIALAVCKYVKRAKSSVILLMTDATIVILGIFVIGDFVLSLLGVVSAFVCSITIDRLFVGQSRAFTAQIISSHPDEICEAVRRRMRRTTTIIDVVGGYSGEEKKMLSVTFARSQYAELTAILSSIDKNAFVTVNRAHEINGEGWTYPHIEENEE